MFFLPLRKRTQRPSRLSPNCNLGVSFATFWLTPVISSMNLTDRIDAYFHIVACEIRLTIIVTTCVCCTRFSLGHQKKTMIGWISRWSVHRAEAAYGESLSSLKIKISLKLRMKWHRKNKCCHVTLTLFIELVVNLPLSIELVVTLPLSIELVFTLLSLWHSLCFHWNPNRLRTLILFPELYTDIAIACFDYC